MTTDAKLEEIDREFDWAFEIFRKETPPACHGRLSKLKDTVFRYIEALKQASERIRASHKRVMDRYASLERVIEAVDIIAEMESTGEESEEEMYLIGCHNRYRQEYPKEAT